jgi:hypothetical protein
MQEQCGNLEAIQFGTMDVKLVSPGNLYVAKNLNQKELVFTSISHVENSAPDDKFGAHYHADSLHRYAVSGSVHVGISDRGQQPAIGQVLPAAGLAQHAANGQLLHAGRQPPLANASALSSVAPSHAGDSHANAASRLTAGTCRRSVGEGFSTPRERSPPAVAGLLAA